MVFHFFLYVSIVLKCFLKRKTIHQVTQTELQAQPQTNSYETPPIGTQTFYPGQRQRLSQYSISPERYGIEIRSLQKASPVPLIPPKCCVLLIKPMMTGWARASGTYIFMYPLDRLSIRRTFPRLPIWPVASIAPFTLQTCVFRCLDED